ncbi:Lrp/AsnC family transcriptional regulator [Halogeometricum sp. CBA1124]|uniref:Lrp/AsnC family transcriptional regulator n=1 Tax=Halogeometricum sp. CBA1124 TaxID=2668071 RepID=UPI001429420A|nr:Lrp/AsnC family transcriptional regulator [Halogeometricum sp. CBA1124]MUV57639.1 winged helix-turn-helix transcriptional regulator [Halogeometricum sp. CBA1124]
MTLQGLDELDRRIIYELQRDARHVSSRDIAADVSASPSTVRKRIQRLEDEGIVRRYGADVDYGRAGYQLFVQIVCTAPIPERDCLCEEASGVDGVVGVRELATGERNVVVTVVGEDGDDLTRIARELSALGLTIAEEQLIRNDASLPYAGFDLPTTPDRVRR